MSQDTQQIDLSTPFKSYISLFLEIFEESEQEKPQQLQQEQLQQQNCFYNNLSESSSSISDSLILDEDQYNINNNSQSSIQQLYSDDKNLQKQNIIKNILKGFLKFTISLKDKDQQKQYSLLYSPHKLIQFSDIKKSLSKRIKEKKTRWNMKLKSILTSERLGPVFFNFLINEAENWLSHSKVANLESHQKLINFLIAIIKKGEAQTIKTYKKK